jgi:hypothetical protein
MVIGHHSYGQMEVEPDTLNNNFLLKKELSGGVVLHNLGMGGRFRKGSNKSFFVSRTLEVEFVSMKHPKQIRVVNPYYFNAKSYVYGKLNHTYMLRVGYGRKKLLNRKPYWGGVELRLVYLGGVGLAFLKPVHLYFWDDNYINLKAERYDPENSYHTPEYIYGRAPFMDGFEQITVSPGLYVKGGLNFEFGQYNTKIKALEAGIIAEFYSSSIAIMAFNPVQNFFFTFYISFEFGKRFN